MIYSWIVIDAMQFVYTCVIIFMSVIGQEGLIIFTYVCIKIAKGQYFIHFSLLNTFCKLKSFYIMTPTIKSP